MARNGSGVKKASSTSIEIEFQFEGQRCRERIKCKPTSANIRRLTLFRDDILESIAAGTFDYQASFPDSRRFKKPEQIDHSQFLYHWLKASIDRKEKLLKASTYDTLRKTTNQLIPALGGHKIAEFKRRHAREYCEKLTCGNRQIRKLLSALRDAFECAVDDEVIESNPLADFKFIKIESPKDDHVDPLTREEVELLINSTDGQFKNLVQFAIWTGLRTSELVALEWGDIDFNRGVMRIARAKTQAARKPETTKTATGRREVKLLPPALAALNAQKSHSFIVGKQIFLNKDHEPYTGPFQIWTQWKRALLKAGIRYRNPYQTRHTFASIMLNAGENINWLASQMGHKTITTTLKHYARFMPDSDDKYGLKAVEMYS